jgi:hypothetical protein
MLVWLPFSFDRDGTRCPGGDALHPARGVRFETVEVSADGTEALVEVMRRRPDGVRRRLADEEPLRDADRTRILDESGAREETGRTR